jgi:hypothetical protein
VGLVRHRPILIELSIIVCVPMLDAHEVLPNPPAPFKGQIDLSYKDSKPDFPKPTHAPKDTSNILLVLLDDVGYGASRCQAGRATCEQPNHTDASMQPFTGSFHSGTVAPMVSSNGRWLYYAKNHSKCPLALESNA